MKFYSKTVEIKKFSHIGKFVLLVSLSVGHSFVHIPANPSSLSADFILSERADYYVNDYLFKVLEAKVPTMSVNQNAQVRLKTFNESTCVVPKLGFCHLDLQHALKNII